MTNIQLKSARICHSQFKCNYQENKKHFLNLLFHSWNLHQILNILKEKMIVIANVYPKLQAVKNLVTKLSKRRCFSVSEHALTVNMWKLPSYLRNLHESAFIMIFSLVSEKLIWKMSSLVLTEILGVFLNTLIGDAMYSVQDCENLPLPIQMQLPEKRKRFSQFSVPFLETTSNFKHFERKDVCQY